MTALWWKELRESAAKVGAGLGAVVLLHLLRRFEDFNRDFSGAVDAWAAGLGVACAAVLAMDAVAGERSRGTLDFLLVRPTTVGRILAAKFAVGAGGLLAVVAAYWAMVYATPLVGISLWQGQEAQAIADIGPVAMVWAWYLPALVVYAAVFMASAATENPVEAVGAGAIAGLVAISLVLLAGALYPGGRPPGTALSDLIAVRIDGTGNLVRVATRTGAVVQRTLLSGILAGVGFAVAVLLAGRFRQFTLSRRRLVVSGFALVALLLALPRLLPDGTQRIRPAATVDVGDGARGLAVAGDVAYVLRRDSLLAVDLSDRDHPRIAAAAAHGDGWSLSSLALLDARACARGHKSATPGDSSAVLCFDLSEPLRPRPAGAHVTAAPTAGEEEEFGFPGMSRSLSLEHLGQVLLAGAVGPTRSTLTSLTIDPGGLPRVADELVLETYEYPEEQWLDGFRYRRGFFLQQHQFDIAPAGSHAYLGLYRGLVVVEVGPGGRLREQAVLDLADRTEHLRGRKRSVVVRGDTAWVERLWPAETVQVDVSDPSQPRVTAVHSAGARRADRLDAGFLWAVQQGVHLYDPAAPYRRPTPVLTLPREDRFWGTRAAVLSDGWGHALMDGQLALFRLPPRRGG